MKKLTYLLFILSFLATLAACSTNQNATNDVDNAITNDVQYSNDNDKDEVTGRNGNDKNERANSNSNDSNEATNSNSNDNNEEVVEEKYEVKIEVILPLYSEYYVTTLSRRFRDTAEISKISDDLTENYTDYGQGWGCYSYSFGKNNCATVDAYTFRGEVTQLEVKTSPQDISPNNMTVYDLIDAVILPTTVFFDNADTNSIIETIYKEMELYSSSSQANGDLTEYWYSNGDFELLITLISYKTSYLKGKTAVSAWGQIKGKHHMWTHSGWPTSQDISAEEAQIDEEMLYEGDESAQFSDVKAKVVEATSLLESVLKSDSRLTNAYISNNNDNTYSFIHTNGLSSFFYDFTPSIAWSDSNGAHYADIKSDYDLHVSIHITEPNVEFRLSSGDNTYCEEWTYNWDGELVRASTNDTIFNLIVEYVNLSDIRKEEEARAAKEEKDTNMLDEAGVPENLRFESSPYPTVTLSGYMSDSMTFVPDNKIAIKGYWEADRWDILDSLGVSLNNKLEKGKRYTLKGKLRYDSFFDIEIISQEAQVANDENKNMLSNISFSEDGEFGGNCIAFNDDGSFGGKINLYEGWGNIEGEYKIVKDGSSHIVECSVNKCNFRDTAIGGDITVLNFKYEMPAKTLTFISHNGREQNGGIGSLWLSTQLQQDAYFISVEYSEYATWITNEWPDDEP